MQESMIRSHFYGDFDFRLLNSSDFGSGAEEVIAGCHSAYCENSPTPHLIQPDKKNNSFNKLCLNVSPVPKIWQESAAATPSPNCCYGKHSGLPVADTASIATCRDARIWLSFGSG
jgi:hypothetical protein